MLPVVVSVSYSQDGMEAACFLLTTSLYITSDVHGLLADVRGWLSAFI